MCSPRLDEYFLPDVLVHNLIRVVIQEGAFGWRERQLVEDREIPFTCEILDGSDSEVGCGQLAYCVDDVVLCNSIEMHVVDPQHLFRAVKERITEVRCGCVFPVSEPAFNIDQAKDAVVEGGQCGQYGQRPYAVVIRAFERTVACDAFGHTVVPLVDVHGADKPVHFSHSQAQRRRYELLSHTPLKDVDAREPPDGIIRANGNIQMKAPIALDEVQPVVAGNIVGSTKSRAGS